MRRVHVEHVKALGVAERLEFRALPAQHRKVRVGHVVAKRRARRDPRTHDIALGIARKYHIAPATRLGDTHEAHALCAIEKRSVDDDVVSARQRMIGALRKTGVGPVYAIAGV